MKNNLYKIFLFFSCILLFSCGFKVLDKSQINNFSIQKILTSGDRTINFKIKNYLLTSVSKDNQKRLIIITLVVANTPRTNFIHANQLVTDKVIS